VNHKRGKPKDARSGCIMCKSWKSNANKDRESEMAMPEQKSRASAREQRAVHWADL
jgi:hypothetical protein